MEASYKEQLLVDHWSADTLLPLPGVIGSHLVFAHYGPIEHAVKERLIRRLEEHSLSSCDPLTMRKRLFNALCEGVDNLVLHTEPESRPSCFVALLRDREAYHLYLGNHVPSSTAQMLLHRVEMLDGMSEADLRECFLKLLANDGRTNRGGAGLGLLTMARKSSRMRAHTSTMTSSHAQMIIELHFDQD